MNIKESNKDIKNCKEVKEKHQNRKCAQFH